MTGAGEASGGRADERAPAADAAERADESEPAGAAEPRVGAAADAAGRAEARLERALGEPSVRDPRPFYRQRLKYLKSSDEGAYSEALRYYEGRVIPESASEEGDPVAVWLAYGVKLAGLGGTGRTLAIDAEGRASEHEGPVPPEEMVLYLPNEARAPAFAVNLPIEASPAQQATFDLLVAGRREIAAA